MARTSDVDKSLRRGRRRALVAAAGLAVCVCTLAPSDAAGQVPPDEDWRVLESRHFRVTYPLRLHALAGRAGAIAERAHSRLATSLADPPGSRIELLLTDHVDGSNGFARMAPYPRITVYARPPVDGFALSHFDDWLDLVITHELAHVFHLEVTGTPGRIARTVFGRVPSSWPFFPGSSTPTWVIEGLATWYESALTGSGRVAGTYFDMVLRAAASAGQFESLDRASGESPAWPAGQRPYAYGSQFFAWLVERHGEERMELFVRAVGSQWIPYRLNSAARSAFGIGFSEAWFQWRAEVVADAEALAVAIDGGALRTRTSPVTEGARQALHANVGPQGALAYARSDGRSDSQIRIRSPEGSERGLRTNGLATFDWAPDGTLVVSQFEWADPYRLWRDLYRADPRGDVERLTWNARVEQPSLTPDGSTAWVVQHGEGASGLARVDLASGRVDTPSALPVGSHWAFPAVSDDGRWVAALRWAGSGAADLVLLDARDGSLAATVEQGGALASSPTWAPGGVLLWTSDRTGVSNVYAAVVGEAGEPGAVRQVTDVLTGLSFVVYDPAGPSLVASHYGVDGWDLARMPYDPTSWVEPGPTAPTFSDPEVATAPRLDPVAGPDSANAEEYSPWRTLLPRYWEPVLEANVEAAGRELLGRFVGFRTEAEDLVGRHAYALQAAWSITDASLEGSASYGYRGLGNPWLTLSVDQFWTAGGPGLVDPGEDAPPDTVFLRARRRRASVGATFFRSRWRRASAVGLSVGLVQEDRRLLDLQLEPYPRQLTRPSARLFDARVTLSTSTARRHAWSTGAEEGMRLWLQARTQQELDRPPAADGGDRSLGEALARMSLYRSFAGPGFADHVLAVRLAGGMARGQGADGFHFGVGGAAGLAEPVTGLDLLGRPRFFPIRGYPPGSRSGRNAWTASGEWRLPLALVNRGLGLFPVHLDRVHGALFVDAGNAWGPRSGVPETLVGVGTEIRAEFSTLFSTPLTLRLGVAQPLVDGDEMRFYVRFGTAF